MSEAVPGMVGTSDEDLVPNGIEADTGQPLPGIDDAAGARVTRKVAADGGQIAESQERANRPETFGAGVDVDVETLSEAGWGVIFAADADADALKDALGPLLRRRQEDAGARFKIFEGQSGVRPGESALDWLARRGTGLDLVDPDLGVPFYLLIVGSPEAIPMDFQYTLDIYWAVGRLNFDALEDYARYAQAVVDYERAVQPPQPRKRAVMFATQHPFDAATTMFTRDVVRPFLDGSGTTKPLGTRQRFRVDAILGEEAAKEGFARVLCGGGGEANVAPALLFSGTHGMVFRIDDPRQEAFQGALVCQDWEGFGAITEDAWFSAADLPSNASLAGMIHFLFACYGGGWEKVDTFRDGPGGQARQIAHRPGVSKLPQQMLARGALAVLAHVDRAWSYSFKTPHGGTQTAGIRDVLTSLMMGLRIGNAVDRFNIKWAALSVPISDALRAFKAGAIPGKQLARLWIARDDARNYMILGDPAVRLRVGEMIDGI